MRKWIGLTSLTLLAAALTAPPALALAQGTGTGEPPRWNPSGAANCSSHSHRDIDPGGGNTVSANTLRRSGPHNTCGSNPVGSTGVDYHCYTLNEDGNTWTWVTVRATGAQGWVYDGNLTNGGSTYPC
ncbi:hypothetical protein [Streptomyces jumonjinensis]|uniref:hypothetical protein n=1 Tax=Streptomyces jumonjinensis TaxID=1945 RepID=UPI0037BD0CB0